MIQIIYLVIALILGILAGTITGLTPGIHINLVAVLLLGASGLFIGIQPIILVTFIVAMSITHTFIDFIPSIFLGAPDEDTVLSILPGHEFLNKGRAYEAIILTLFGSFAAVIIILILVLPSIFFLPKIYPYVQNIMPFILLIASGFLIYFEKKSKIWALFIFLLAGFLGISAFNLPLKEPFLPLLTGLFGASSLVTSIMKKQKIPKQKIEKIKIIKNQTKNKSIAKALFASAIASPLCCFLPALGSGQAAVIGSEVFGDLDRKEFLILLGSINTIVMGFSFITLYTVEKARTGAAVAVSKLLTEISLMQLGIILFVILFSGIIAFFLTVFLAKIFSRKISKFNYNKLSLTILILLSIIVFMFSGFLGFLLFIVSASLGLTCIFLGIKRIHLMGSLLVPTILFYLL